MVYLLMNHFCSCRYSSQMKFIIVCFFSSPGLHYYSMCGGKIIPRLSSYQHRRVYGKRRSDCLGKLCKYRLSQLIVIYPRTMCVFHNLKLRTCLSRVFYFNPFRYSLTQ